MLKSPASNYSPLPRSSLQNYFHPSLSVKNKNRFPHSPASSRSQSCPLGEGIAGKWCWSPAFQESVLSSLECQSPQPLPRSILSFPTPPHPEPNQDMTLLQGSWLPNWSQVSNIHSQTPVWRNDAKRHALARKE